MINDLSLFAQAVEELRKLGIVLRMEPGAYLVNYIYGTDDTASRTDELADAVAQGHKTAKTRLPPPLPPMGPTGRRMTRRSAMLKHNNKIAARRRREAANLTTHQLHNIRANGDDYLRTLVQDHERDRQDDWDSGRGR